MKYHFTLRYALPLGLFAAVLAMLAATFAVDVANDRAEALERTREQAILMAERIARTAERGQHSEDNTVAADISIAYTAQDVSSVVVLDAKARVELAHRMGWKGHAATDVLPDFSMARFERVVRGNQPDLTVSADQARLSVMTPYALRGSDADLRSQERGVVYAEYDLGYDYAMVFWGSWQRLIPQAAMAAVLLAVLMWVLRRNVIQPIWQLERSVERFAQNGEQMPPQEAGPLEVVRLARSFSSMTERVAQVQHSLVASQARIEGIVEAAMDAIITVDQNHCMVVVNQAALDLFQYRIDEVLGQPVSMLMPAEMERTHDKLMDDFVATGVTRRAMSRNAVVRGRKRDGSTFPAEASISHLTLEGATLLTVIMRDVTERQRAVEEIRALNVNLESLVAQRTATLESTLQALSSERHKLQLANEQQQAIFELVTVGIVLLSGRTIVRTNRKLQEIFGYSAGELIGRDARLWYTDDATYTRMGEVLRAMRDNGTLHQSEVEMLRKDGSLLWARVSVRPFVDPEHPDAVLAVVEDMTLAHDASLAIEQARLRAEEASQAKSSFLANMSHEIRTPMNAIMGMTYLAMKTELSERQRGYLNKIQSSSQHLLGIINDILDYSKIEAGKLNIEHIEFELDKVLENVAGLVSEKAASKGLELVFDVEPGVPLQLLGDPLRLGQILINYANNAVKFTNAGQVEIRVRKHDEDEAGVQLHFAVKDTGIGLAPDQIENLFQSFQQADASTTRRFGGTGLGLAISKQLATLMHGDVGVQSELGKGSTFWFTVRLEKSHSPMRTRILRSELFGKRVLVVDDNDSARTLLGDMLKTMNLQADTAHTGPDALDAVYKADYEGQPYEILFLDWQMPGMNGVDLAKRIRALPLKEQPLQVLVTGYGREEVLKSAEEAGIHNVLVKPVSASMLFDCVVRELSGSQSGNAMGVPRKMDGGADLSRIRGARVLLVEDNALNQEVAVELLRGVGLVVDVAADGQAAVVQVQAADYALVLMDMQMPVMDGLTATRLIRAMPRLAGLPIVAMTANAMQADREACLEAGMNDHLSKPIEPEYLFESLLRWIPARRQYVTAPMPVVLPAHDADAPLPQVSGLDTEAGMRRVMGNRTLYMTLLRKFVQGQRNVVLEIEQALEGGDRPLARRLAHTLKSVAASIGLVDVAQSAARIEAEAPSGDRMVIAQHLHSLQSILFPALEALAAAVPPESASAAGGPVNAAQALRLMESLAALLADDDMQAGDLLQENAAVLQAACGAAFADLRAAVQAFDFEGALAILKRCMETLND